jgi:hypothetical protein
LRLLELTNDYVRFCNTAALKLKKQELNDMNDVLMGEGRCKDVVTKKGVKDIFINIYKS